MTSELVALTITLFVVGFCVGPLLWGPLSEQVSVCSLLKLDVIANRDPLLVRTQDGAFALLPYLHGQPNLYLSFSMTYHVPPGIPNRFRALEERRLSHGLPSPRRNFLRSVAPYRPVRPVLSSSCALHTLTLASCLP